MSHFSFRFVITCGGGVGEAPLKQTQPRTMVTFSSDEKKEKISALLVAARDGDREAFDRLYRMYFAPLWRFALSRVGDRDLADDIVQETFLKAFRLLVREDRERTEFMSFLFLIASSLIKDNWRKKKEVLLEREELTRLRDARRADRSFARAEADIDRRERVRFVAAALEQLPPRRREILILRLINEFSYAQIAEIIGISPAAARQRYRRALGELRRALENNGYRDYV